MLAIQSNNRLLHLWNEPGGVYPLRSMLTLVVFHKRTIAHHLAPRQKVLQSWDWLPSFVIKMAALHHPELHHLDLNTRWQACQPRINAYRRLSAMHENAKHFKVSIRL